MATRLEQIEEQMGVDLRLEYTEHGGFYEDADLAASRDLQAARGIDNFVQAVANRLKTRKGELAQLGHPEYGSRHHELMGQPNVERTRRLIKLYVLQALRQEPRIESVETLDVKPEVGQPEAVRIELSVRPIGAPRAVNLIVPFSLEG